METISEQNIHTWCLRKSYTTKRARLAAADHIEAQAKRIEELEIAATALSANLTATQARNRTNEEEARLADEIFGKESRE